MNDEQNQDDVHVTIRPTDGRNGIFWEKCTWRNTSSEEESFAVVRETDGLFPKGWIGKDAFIVPLWFLTRDIGILQATLQQLVEDDKVTHEDINEAMQRVG